MIWWTYNGKAFGVKPAAHRTVLPKHLSLKGKSSPKYCPLNVDLVRATFSNVNRFSSPSGIEDMNDSTEANILHNAPKNVPKPHPTVADTHVPVREIHLLLGDNYIYKRTSTGTMIFPQSQEEYDFCVQTLKEGLVEFHSYNDNVCIWSHKVKYYRHHGGS